MTADGFGQLQAEDTPMAAWFKSMKVRACVVDEAHQLNSITAATIAARVNHMILVYDDAQYIKQTKQCPMSTPKVLQEKREPWPWTKTVQGGSVSAATEHLDPTHLETENIMRI